MCNPIGHNMAMFYRKSKFCYNCDALYSMIMWDLFTLEIRGIFFYLFDFFWNKIYIKFIFLIIAIHTLIMKAKDWLEIDKLVNVPI